MQHGTQTILFQLQFAIDLNVILLKKAEKVQPDSSPTFLRFLTDNLRRQFLMNFWFDFKLLRFYARYYKACSNNIYVVNL